MPPFSIDFSLMEPYLMTFLFGLSGIICGYMFWKGILDAI